MEEFTPNEKMEFTEWWKEFFADKDVTFSEDEMKQIVKAFISGVQRTIKDNST